MQLTTRHNSKSIIFLKKTEHGVLASVFFFDVWNNSRLAGQKLLTQIESDELLTQKQILESQNIFIVEERAAEPIVLLEYRVSKSYYPIAAALIPSPYIFIFREAEFFSTQKTRAPNN